MIALLPCCRDTCHRTRKQEDCQCDVVETSKPQHLKTRCNMSIGRLPSMVSATIIAVVLAGGTALLGYANAVYCSGQGLIADGFGGYDLKTELCGVENGAEVDGPYLLWVLTASAASNANITGPWGTAQMVQSGNGAYKYVSGWSVPVHCFQKASSQPTTADREMSNWSSATAAGPCWTPGRGARPASGGMRGTVRGR